MKKLILCASLVCLGMLSSCQKDELVPADEKPEWLGSSIYEELQSGRHLSGTFNNYLRLVNDLGYDEVLGRTGSKTIFPANDEAFERFFQSDNAFGVKSYDELSVQQKKLLLYTSMLDNAMLTSMLSNIEADDNNVTRGVAIKHETNLSVSDFITPLYNGAEMPQNNSYWDNYRTRGINVVYDGTKSMLVHFTNEQMLQNNISCEGVNSDFGILRGDPIGSDVPREEPAYIFQNRIISENTVCTNGYIHQVQDVIVPPGNLGQVLRSEPNTKLFSRILDYHCAPYYDANTTMNYNSWARQNGVPTIDSIFQVRYFSLNRSQGGSGNTSDPYGNSVPGIKRLAWDPGWNQYSPSSDSKLALGDMGAILVPTDDAVKKYFLPGGIGSYFIDLYGVEGLPNTEANLPENLDALFNKGNGILTTFVNNMMQNSFVASVPSKFGTITQSGSGDFMLLTLDSLAKKDGKYDVVVANNGVIYKMNSMIVPDEYQSVIGPVTTYPDMSLMKHFASDKTDGATNAVYGVDLYYYLMAMKSNYAFFCPSNEAMQKCFIDPVSLGNPSGSRALEFYEHEVQNGNRVVMKYGVRFHKFNPATGVIDRVVDGENSDIEKDSPSAFKSQVGDMLNYSTIVLKEGEKFGQNHYYLTKHGGAIRLDNYSAHFDAQGNRVFTGEVRGGAQIDNGVAPANIIKGWDEKNGVALKIDGFIQPSITSVYMTLEKGGNFSKFIDMCAIFSDSELLEWAGISSQADETNGRPAMQEKYKVFADKGGKALDMNINFFNGYNYTFYAPNDNAMEMAYAQMGLPTEEDIRSLYEKYSGSEDDYGEDEILEAKAITFNKINALRAFVRYHFMNNSVFADNNVPATTYQSMYSSELGIPVNLRISSAGGVLSVRDEQGKTVTINANGSTGIVNKMARDYEYDKKAAEATSIALSSFAAVHEISTPLCYTATGRFDNLWNTPAAVKAAAKYYKQNLNMIKNLKD